MRRPTLFVLLITSACGSSAAQPDATYTDMCGPVKADAGRPNTLLDRIDGNTTLLKACSPYYFTDPIVIGADLTIEAGVTLIGPQGGKRSRLTVNRYGRILATGTAAEPIVFTSLYAESGGALGGQWTGILFLEGLPGSHLEHVIVEYAGGPYARQAGDDEFGIYEFPVEGSILNDSTPDLVLADVWVRHSNGYALATTTSEIFDLDQDNVYAIADRLTFTDNLNGLWLPVDQVGALGPDLCWFERDAMGMCPTGGTPPVNFVESHIDQNLGRTPENLTKDATWEPYAVPYKVDNINITGGALLTVLDGVELQMTGTGGISVGVNGPGALSMIAANPGGIRVTSFYQNPTPAQHWFGLVIWEMADAARTHIENVDLGYGGRRSPINSEAAADIEIYNTSPTIIGNHVHHSLGAGIHWNCNADPLGLEDPPLPSTNTSDDSTIACAMSPPPPVGTGIGVGIAENFGCDCPGTACSSRCPPSGL